MRGRNVECGQCPAEPRNLAEQGQRLGFGERQGESGRTVGEMRKAGPLGGILIG